MRSVGGITVGVALALTTTGCWSPAVDTPSGPVVVRFHLGEDDPRVEATGLAAGVTRSLEGAAGTDRAFREVFPVHVGEPPWRAGAERPTLLGSYSVERDVVVFRPRFPFARGQTYHARWIPGDGSPPASASVRIGETLAGPPPRVTAIYPSADELPENLLRIYVHFSIPMSREQVVRDVRLVGPEGPVEMPFVVPGQELWDPDRTRLTLILDPGRLKRGVGPNLELGPVLAQGREYRLEILEGFRDGAGRGLAEGATKIFRVAGADRSGPEPERWELVPPLRPRGPVGLGFREPLDHGMLGHAIRVECSGSQPLPGRVSIGAGETSWTFVPNGEWPPGPCRLVVDPALEDPSGNSVRRTFEARLPTEVGRGERRGAIRLEFRPREPIRG